MNSGKTSQVKELLCFIAMMLRNKLHHVVGTEINDTPISFAFPASTLPLLVLVLLIVLMFLI